MIILTYNEEKHIDRAIQSISGLASQIFIIDSHSSDRTVELAQARGAIVLQNRFVNYAQQFQWGLDNAPIASEWIMRLDADEIIEPDLADELRRQLPKCGPEVTGINLKRKHIFMGRWIRRGGRYPLILLRVWRHGAARIEQRWMDEHMVLLKGQAITVDGGFADYNLNDLTFFTQKHNHYATREALDIINQRYALFKQDTIKSSSDNSIQAYLKRLIKERIYNRIPFFVAAPAYFLFRYIVQLGFLDGIPGAVYHFLQGCWYRFLVGAKVAELEMAFRDAKDDKQRIDLLSRLTGYRLTE